MRRWTEKKRTISSKLFSPHINQACTYSKTHFLSTIWSLWYIKIIKTGLKIWLLSLYLCLQYNFLSYCSFAVKRHHYQCNSSKRKHLIGSLFTVSEGEAINMAGSRQAWHWSAAHRAPVSALCALEPSSRALGKGLEVENTDRHRDRPTHRPLNTDTKAPFY